MLAKNDEFWDHVLLSTPNDDSKVKVVEMNQYQAYFALLKAYCAINVLLLPKAFRNGGFALSPLSLMVACTFECTCAIKLSQCGNFTKKISYAEIVKHAFGQQAQTIFQIMIAIVQFQFTISMLAFVIESIESTINAGRKHDVDSTLGKV